MNLINENNQFVPPNEDNSYTLKNREFILLQPNEKRLVLLPYKKTYDKNEIIIFNIDLDFISLGANVLWTNLNDEDSCNGIKILLHNINIDNPLNQNVFNSIVGSPNRIKIKPNTILGQIRFFENKIDKIK